jgi:molybdopterin synthase sulfur carrier subunit
MKVAVTFYAYLREVTGKKERLVMDLGEGATVAELLRVLCNDSRIRIALLDENLQLKSEITILKNGREIKFLDGLDTTLTSGDEISVFPMVAGGNQTV